MVFAKESMTNPYALDLMILANLQIWVHLSIICIIIDST